MSDKLKQIIVPFEDLVKTNPDLGVNYELRTARVGARDVPVSLDKGRIGELRYVYHVDVGTGKPLYDNFVIYEGPKDEHGERNPVCGEISVPFYLKDRHAKLGLITIERPVSFNPSTFEQGAISVEFPRGITHLGKRGGETATAELQEETGFLAEERPHYLGRINSNSGFVASLVDSYAVRVDEQRRSVGVQSLDERIAKCEFLTRDEIDGKIDDGKIFCGLTLAALGLFDRFYKKMNQ